MVPKSPLMALTGNEESNIAPTWLMDHQRGSPVAQKSPLVPNG